MSDEQLYGQEHTEAATFGNFPLRGSEPPEPAELTVQEAANEIARPETAPTIERDYIRRDRPIFDDDGKRVVDENGLGLYERQDSRGYVTAEQAGEDLAEIRKAEAAMLAAEEQAAIQKTVDEIRSGAPATEQGETVEQWGQRLAQQPAPPSNADLIAQLKTAIEQTDSALQNTSDVNFVAGLQNQRQQLAKQLEEATYRAAFEQYPELTHSIEAEINQRTAQYRQQVSQAFEHAQTAVQTARAAVLSKYPELQGVKSDQDLVLGLNVMAQSNQQRYAEAVRDLGHMAATVQNAQQLQQQHAINQAVQHQKQFEDYRKAQIEIFESRNPEFKDAEYTAKVSRQAVDYLKERGLSDSELAEVWRSPIAQHHAFQEVLADALRYRESKATIKEKLANPVRQVQRPGSPVERLPDRDVDLVALDRRLSQSGNVKDARDLLIALRGRR
jgi:hypothetical protein